MLLGSGNRKIRIFSKKLSSGNCQVKFFVDSDRGRTYYGYTLVKSGCKVSDVIAKIYKKLQDIEHPDKYFHSHLLSIGNKKYPDPDFIIFRDEIKKFNLNPIDRTNTYEDTNRTKSRAIHVDNNK